MLDPFQLLRQVKPQLEVKELEGREYLNSAKLYEEFVPVNVRIANTLIQTLEDGRQVRKWDYETHLYKKAALFSTEDFSGIFQNFMSIYRDLAFAFVFRRGYIFYRAMTIREYRYQLSDVVGGGSNVFTAPAAGGDGSGVRWGFDQDGQAFNAWCSGSRNVVGNTGNWEPMGEETGACEGVDGIAPCHCPEGFMEDLIDAQFPEYPKVTMLYDAGNVPGRLTILRNNLLSLLYHEYADKRTAQRFTDQSGAPRYFKVVRHSTAEFNNEIEDQNERDEINSLLLNSLVTQRQNAPGSNKSTSMLSHVFFESETYI